MAEVTFGETSTGAAMVQGSYVGQGQSMFIFRCSSPRLRTLNFNSESPYNWTGRLQRIRRVKGTNTGKWYVYAFIISSLNFNFYNQARRKIRQVQAALHISEHTGDQAQRWYTLAVEHRFTKGRRSELVVAVCLYVACRMSNTSHMLIDFSDMLQVSSGFTISFLLPMSLHFFILTFLSHLG